MPNYLDDTHHAEISKYLDTFTGRTEWPTWLLIIGFYSAWAGIVLLGSAWGKVLSAGVLLPLLILWMSLQHECIHGHPTRWPALNKALVFLPFAIWYPYRTYRDSHLAHHDDSMLTVPGVDPESRYVSAAEWDHSPYLKHIILWLNKTIIGRLAVGVPLAVWTLISCDIPLAIKNKDGSLLMWAYHLIWVGLILWLVDRYSALSAMEYVFYVSVPALAVGMIRSFYEHRPAEQSAHRTVINESRGVLSWLFLNLNFHLVHHDIPKLPWYYLPKVYAARRTQWISRCGGFVVPNYRQLVRAHWINPVDSPVHPFSAERDAPATYGVGVPNEGSRA